MAIDKDELERRKALTFAQAEGAAPLPSQLALGTLSAALVSRLWDAIYGIFCRDIKSGFLPTDPSFLRGNSAAVMRQFWIRGLHRMADEYSLYFLTNVKVAKSQFDKDDYIKTLDFVQFFLRESREYELPLDISRILSEERAAYRLVDGDTIVPVASDEEAATLMTAFEKLEAENQRGGRKHLLDAAAWLTKGDFASSVRESIHAVEAVVRSTTGKANFKDALLELDKQQPMHRAFRDALIKLYGYSSDEEGIRHPLLEGEHPNVSERDALFFIGVCAAFVTYLLSPTD